MGWLDLVLQHGRKISFHSREVLLTANRRDERLLILLSGTATAIAGGKRVGEIGAGGFIGVEGIADGGASPFTVLADQPGQAIALDREAAVRLMKSDQEFAVQIAHVLAGHVRMLAGEVPVKKPAASPAPQKKEEPAGAREEAAAPAVAAAAASPETAAPERPAAPKKEVLPVGHPLYRITAPESWSRLTVEKEHTCPICGKTFADRSPSSYKLKTKEIREDMRVIYDNFEILWYSVRVCPHCNAAAPANAFSRFNSRDARFLESHGYFSDYPRFSGWSTPREVDEVFESLYLSIRCIDLSSRDVQTEAQIWRRLMWLYDDVGDDERHALAKRFTLEKYREVFETKNIVGEEEQQLNIILGDLYRSEKDRQSAYRHYMNVIQLGKTGNPLLYTHATDAISELRRDA